MRHGVGSRLWLVGAVITSLGAFAVACSDSGSVVLGGDGAPDIGRSDTAPEDTHIDAPADLPSDVIVSRDIADASEVVRPCASNAECAMSLVGAVCDTATGRCVRCLAAADTCPAAEHCDEGSRTCVPGCRNDDGCAGATGDAGADGGASARSRCDRAVHACVECVTDTHCGAGRLCVGNTCVVGCSPSHGCRSPETCCSGACVDTQTQTVHCGRCDLRCAATNGVSSCMNGTCAIGSCTAPFADCDLAVNNGCEANTLTDLGNCGSCGRACPARAHAATTCALGACGFTCDSGFADCNADAGDGCEVDLSSDLSRCGSCTTLCNPPHAAAACRLGACFVGTCEMGFANCDANPTNGCEVDTRTAVSHCGVCGNGCPARPNAFPGCVAAACVISCVAGFADCNGEALDGCEVDTRATAAHCGACGRRCALARATSACAASACSVARCDPGFGDCNLEATDGCEVDTRSTLAHCGTCGGACTARAHAASMCASGACGFVCDAGFADCNGDALDGCEADLNADPAHCGACRRACFACASGVCATGLTSVRDGSITAGVDQRYQYAPVDPGAGFVRANWDATPGATGYLVRLGTTVGGAESATARRVSGVSYTFTELSVRGAWDDVTYYVTVVPVSLSGEGTAATSNGVQIAELATWDGLSTAGLTRGFTAAWPASGLTAWYGEHYFETVDIAATTTVRVQGFGRVGSVPENVSATDARVTRPGDGWLAIRANEITVHGVITASGRGYGGGGAGGGGAGSLGQRGHGGVNGLGGAGGAGEGSITGGGGGGSPGGVGGRAGEGPGGNGTVLGGGSGGTGCSGRRGRDGGDGPSANVGGAGAVATSSVVGLGGSGEFEAGGANGVAGCDNWTGGGGGGYGGGASGGTQWDGPGVEAGGGGGGGTGGGGGGEAAGGAQGAGPFAGAGGAAGSSGSPGGYGAAGTNGDTSTDRSLRLGSGGGGGGAGNSQEAGGGGGAAGGGGVTLYADRTLTVGATARITANGAGGGGGSRDNGGGSSSGSGGGGAGGGIVLEGRALALSGAIVQRISARAGGGGVANGGTIKLFYTTLSGAAPTAANAGRVFDAGPGSFR